MTVTRYVVTHVDPEGHRRLTFAAQGNRTYATPEAAWRVLDDFEPGLRGACGANMADSLAVCACPCEPGYHDPQSIWFEVDDIVEREPGEEKNDENRDNRR